jgi:outer membrane protein assembly factor BamB/orotate phosphoribosyltransferase
MDSKRQQLKQLIVGDVFLTRGKGNTICAKNGLVSEWIFDFRRVLLKPKALRLISDIFADDMKKGAPFQVGGEEVAAIPLLTGLGLLLEEEVATNIFFIRKSRKKDGLMRMVEGEITDDKIILVDDIINTGQSFMRQVEILEQLGKKVEAVWTILRFRDIDYYSYFRERGIKIYSVLDLNDLSDSIDVKNAVSRSEPPVPRPFEVLWRFASDNPNFYYVVPKSAPAIDDSKVYFGSDSGNFWAINQADGSIAWKYKILFGAKGKYIFSSPAIHKNTVYFGAYDGNFYALDKDSGKKRWVFMEADWVGSSPCIAQDIGRVFVGLEFGLWKKKGGVVALDANTGVKMWDYSVPGLVHSSPAYCKKHQIVVIGSNDGTARAFNAKTGVLLWEVRTGGEIKESFAFDNQLDLVVFGSHDHCIYVVNVKTGKTIYKVETDEAICSSPLVYEGCAYIASLDKNLYAIDLNYGNIVWKFQTGARIFASPVCIQGKIYIGSNDGRLYELDAKTGKNTAIAQVTERITNAVAYNERSKTFFLPTFANEIYALREIPTI